MTVESLGNGNYRTTTNKGYKSRIVKADSSGVAVRSLPFVLALIFLL